MGIHNEEGSGKVKTDLPGLVKTMLAQLLDTNDTDRAFIDIKPNDDVILMINNFGGISPLELSGITYEVCTQLEDYKLNSKRVLVGMYMTSLNGMGFSISIMKEFDTGSKSLLELLDAPVAATGWSDALPASVWSNGAHQSSEVKSARDDTKSCNLYGMCQFFKLSETTTKTSLSLQGNTDKFSSEARGGQEDPHNWAEQPYRC